MRTTLAAAATALLMSIAGTACASGPAEEPYAEARERLARKVNGYAQSLGEPADPDVVRAMGEVPRHLFVPPAQRGLAYEDHPLPIGRDQTISQPSLVAMMSHLLRPERDDVMLEVGTGSGYQAAILSRLVNKVYSIEIVGELAREAEQRLEELGYDNVEVRHGDGYLGWPEQAPFDGIIVTAGAEHLPQPLVEQLKPGGRIVIPVGPAGRFQELRVITKQADGSIADETIGDVRFVPLTRETRE